MRKSDYTVADVAELLKISNPTVYRLINTGMVRAYKVGRGTRITRSSVEQLRNGGAA